MNYPETWYEEIEEFYQNQVIAIDRKKQEKENELDDYAKFFQSTILCDI